MLAMNASTASCSSLLFVFFLATLRLAAAVVVVDDEAASATSPFAPISLAILPLPLVVDQKALTANDATKDNSASRR